MNQSQWISKMSATYEIHLHEIRHGYEFVDHEYEVSDPSGKGISFKIGFNKKGEASLLVCGDLKRFNIAEGYTPGDIIDAASSLLSGSISVIRSYFLNRPIWFFNTSRGKVRIKVPQPIFAYKRRDT